MDIFDIYDILFKQKFPKLRTSQIELLQKIQENYDKKIIEIDAPTGAGKSLVNMIAALYFEQDWYNNRRKIYISTQTKALQYQYIESFSDILEENEIRYAIGVGVQSFVCLRFKKQMPYCIASYGYGCSHFPNIIKINYRDFNKLEGDYALYGLYAGLVDDIEDVEVLAISKNTSCYYFQNEINVAESKVVFMNNHYLISHILNETLPFPSVLILDEAHAFNEVFSDMLKISISKKEDKLLKDVGIYTTREDFVKNSLDYEGVKIFLQYLTDMSEYILEQAKERKGWERMFLIELQSKAKLYSNLLDFIESRDEKLAKYIILNKNEKYLDIIPSYFLGNLFLEYLDTFIRHKMILSSATLPPKKYTVGEVRISSYMNMYPVTHRPVILLKDAPTITNTSVLNSNITNYIINIINTIWQYKNLRKIVIHSINNYLKEYIGSILETVGYPVLITGENISEDLKKWKNMEEGILISAALEDGVDLKYNLALVQIILKLPMGNTHTDLYLGFLRKYFKDLYEFHVAKRLAQMSGRIVRAANDVGLTIVLDRRVLSHFQRYASLYPKFLRDAIRIQTLKMLKNSIADFSSFAAKAQMKWATNSEEVDIDTEYNIKIMRFLSTIKNSKLEFLK